MPLKICDLAGLASKYHDVSSAENACLSELGTAPSLISPSEKCPPRVRVLIGWWEEYQYFRNTPHRLGKSQVHLSRLSSDLILVDTPSVLAARVTLSSVPTNWPSRVRRMLRARTGDPRKTGELSAAIKLYQPIRGTFTRGHSLAYRLEPRHRRFQSRSAGTNVEARRIATSTL